MTALEFVRLSQIYGGVVARWPADRREAALAFCATDPDFARGALVEAETLNVALDAWSPLSVSQDLGERVVGLAGNLGSPRWLEGWFWPTGIGVGLAGACAAGLVLGVSLSSATSSVPASDEPISAVMSSFELPSPAETADAIT